MEGGEDTDWISDGFTQNGDGTPSGGKRRLTRRKGFAFRVSNMNRPHDPGGGVNCVRSPIPRKDQITKLPLDMEKTSNNRPAWTPIESTKQTERNFVSRNKKLAVKEAARSEIVLLKPNRCQKSDKKDRGLNLGNRPRIPDCDDDCDIQMSPGHHSVMSEDIEVEPRLIRMCPVRMNDAPKRWGEGSVASCGLFGRSGKPIDGWILEIG